MAILCHQEQNSTQVFMKIAAISPDFNQICNLSLDFHTSLQYQISRKSVQWGPR